VSYEGEDSHKAYEADLLARIAELGAELVEEREHPTNILQCAACQRLAVMQNVKISERAEQAEAALESWNQQRIDIGSCPTCGANYGLDSRRLKQAETALAERDTAITHAYRLWLQHHYEDIGELLFDFSTDFRVRAEEGGET
jgi:hypothetical protein